MITVWQRLGLALTFALHPFAVPKRSLARTPGRASHNAALPATAPAGAGQARTFRPSPGRVPPACHVPSRQDGAESPRKRPPAKRPVILNKDPGSAIGPRSAER